MILSALPVVHLAQVRDHDLPARDDWLTASERCALAALRLEKRRTEWRMGRWAAKQAVQLCLPVGMDVVEVYAAPDGAPEVRVPDRVAPAISISHRERLALCAATSSGLRLGCDVETIEPRSRNFIVDYFTCAEAERVLAAQAAERAVLANLCWSAKEAALKVLRVGLRFDTRTVEVALPDRTETHCWQQLHVRAAKACFQGAWRQHDGCVQTVLADGPFQLSYGTGEVWSGS